MKGTVFRKGELGYEDSRRKAVWHACPPDRFPEIIIEAQDESDVVETVQLARKEGRKISVRSGGHSWAGSHLRDGVILLDLSRLRDLSVDREARTATAQPGIKGSELDEKLAAQGLFFPVGHCKSVCIGGYLLQGGFGWRGRELGPACMSVAGIDVVTADGEITYADDRENSDLFWAARGAGPGFFGIVTRFHLKLYPRHTVTLGSTYFYPGDVWQDYFSWSREIESNLPAQIEVNALMFRDDPDLAKSPMVTVLAVAFADSNQEARELLSAFESCPVRNHALSASTNQATSIGELTSVGSSLHYHADKGYIADNMWTHASFDQLLPGLAAIHKTLPAPPSHMVWFPWKLTPARPSMAYSLEDELYIAVYEAWDRIDGPPHARSWVTERMRAMEDVASGIQLADENLLNRPACFISNENMVRLDQIRKVYDPDGLFVSWLGRRAATTSA